MGFSFYKILFRPFLFLLPPETAHELTFKIAEFFWRFKVGRWITHRLFAASAQKLGLNKKYLFLNPVGLAAGFDKNALLLPGLQELGFGFVEIGTVTPRSQSGNPKPRLKRLSDKCALLNRMGFNNDGADVIAERVRLAKPGLRIPLGVNMGKNKDTPNSLAEQDYLIVAEKFRDLADYFVVNISSPNTPELRSLQNENFLKSLGEKLKAMKLRQKIFIKLAPDLKDENLDSILALVHRDTALFSGLILTNTIPTDLGGISGLPLMTKSYEMLQKVRAKLGLEIPVISVGGIFTAEEAQRRLDAGASAVQLYTGLIYEGPGLVQRVVQNLKLPH